MTVTPALTSPELDNLTGASTLMRYLSPVPDTVVATARVNQAVFSYPLTQLTVDGTSAGWANVREGQTVYIGSTAGGRNRGVYRVRLAGNSTTLYLQEMGQQDPGQQPIDYRSQSISNDDYITVLQRWDIWSVLPRIDPLTGLIYEDYNRSPGTLNSTPPPLVEVVINGRRNHLFTLISGDTLAISASVAVSKWPTSTGSTLEYTWDVPDAWTDVEGDDSDTLSASAPPGNYVLRVEVDDSIGGVTERVIHVHIHDRSTNPPIRIAEMPRSDSRNRTGRRMSFSLYNDALAAIPAGAMVGYFEAPTWGGGDVPSATRQFVGWVQRQQLDGRDGLREASIELVGPAALLGIMYTTSQVIQAVATPTTWQQCVPSLSSSAFMAWYMLRWRAANVLRLFDFTPFSVSPSGQRLPEWIIDKGSLLQQMESLASERGNFGANSEGSLFFLRHPSLVDVASRGAVVERDALDESIYRSVSIGQERRPRVQQVRGEGFSWDGSAALPTPYYSDAPKVPGEGSRMTKLAAQVVTGQAELDQLTGDEYARANNPYPELSASIPKNRDVYEPAEMAFVQVDVPAYLMATGAAWSKRCVPLSVSKRHNADGTSDLELVLEAETHGLPGDYVPVPAPNDSLYTPVFAPSPIEPIPPVALGDFSITIPTAVPPTLPASSAPSIVPGRATIYNSSDACYRSYDLVTFDDVTPGWFTQIKQMVLDRGTPFSRRAYVLGNNGTDSRVAFTEDVFEADPVWQFGEIVSGIYDLIESVRDQPGMIYIFGTSTAGEESEDDEWVLDLDFTQSSYGFEIGTHPTIAGFTNAGRWVAGQGFQLRALNFRAALWATSPTFSPTTVDRTATVYYYDNADPYEAGPFSFSNGDQQVTFSNDTTNRVNMIPTPIETGTNLQLTANGGSNAVNVKALSMGIRHFPGSVENGWAPIYLKRAIWAGTGDKPAIGAGVVRSRFSGNYGENLEDPRVVAPALEGTPGFSTGPLGLVAMAGGDEEVVGTDTDGGEYSPVTYGEAEGSYPITIHVPDYLVGSASKSNKKAPFNYVYAAPVAMSSHALWRVVSTGRLGITPEVGSDLALGVTPWGLDMWRGKRILYIGEADGTRYLFRTTSGGLSWGAETAMAEANSVRALRFSKTGNEWIVAAGSNGLKVTANMGASWSTIATGDDALYAELFG